MEWSSVDFVIFDEFPLIFVLLIDIKVIFFDLLIKNWLKSFENVSKLTTKKDWKLVKINWKLSSSCNRNSILTSDFESDIIQMAKSSSDFELDNPVWLVTPNGLSLHDTAMYCPSVIPICTIFMIVLTDQRKNRHKNCEKSLAVLSS